MTRAIFPDLNTEENIRRKKLHKKFYEEIVNHKNNELHLVVFPLEGLKFAIEIEKVDEVVPTPAIKKLPKTPDYIPGLAEIRGTELVMLDLAAKLGLVNKGEKITDSLFTIVIASNRFTVGILSKEIPSNIRVTGDKIQPTGLDIANNPEDETYIKGVIKHDNESIYFIDIDELLEGDRNDQF